jgi:hypothetical protein
MKNQIKTFSITVKLGLFFNPSRSTGPEGTSKLKDIKDTKRQQRQIMTNVEK